jgi:hypothetical protein
MTASETIDTGISILEIPPDKREPRRTSMADTSEDRLRGLIRLIPPARALKEDLEQSIHLETFSGTGDLAVRSFQGLQSSIAAIAADPYVSSLTLNVGENATDKEKVSLARLATGQLLAYLEGQTGLVSIGSGRGNHVQIQRAPVINLSNVTGLPADALGRLVDTVTQSAPESTEGQAEEP